MSISSSDFSREPVPDSQSKNDSQRQAVYWVGAGLQLLAISLCLEMLLGISTGLSMLLRLVVLASIAACVVLRLGWLALVALQISLIVLEPRSGLLPANAAEFFYVLVSMAVIVAAMKLPKTHRFATDYVASFFVIEVGAPKRGYSFVLGRFAISTLKTTLIVIVAGVLLSRVPIGVQAESWLEWSRQNGQAVWPGALLIVLLIAVLVLVRESAWRQLSSSQASLYLRSVQLIASYNDLFGFERHRLRRLRKALLQGSVKTPAPVKRPKLRRNRQSEKTNEKGLK